MHALITSETDVDGLELSFKALIAVNDSMHLWAKTNARERRSRIKGNATVQTHPPRPYRFRRTHSAHAARLQRAAQRMRSWMESRRNDLKSYLVNLVVFRFRDRKPPKPSLCHICSQLVANGPLNSRCPYPCTFSSFVVSVESSVERREEKSCTSSSSPATIASSIDRSPISQIQLHAKS